MIKAIIVDVDGVLVGNKKNFNWPSPNIEIIETLKKLREKGIIVSLCTGKGTFAIKEMVESAHLDNLHVGDGGAVIMDFLNNLLFEVNSIEKNMIKTLIKEFIKNNIYIELYTADNYFITENESNDELRIKHADILYRTPIIVNDLTEVIAKQNIIKVMPIAKNDNELKKVNEIFTSFNGALTLQWGTHPTALPAKFGIITNKNISKGVSVKKISDYYNIPLSEILGVGDGLTDWGFIKLCGYKGIMGNATQELKDKIESNDKNSFIGKGINENGLLSILKYFKLI